MAHKNQPEHDLEAATAVLNRLVNNRLVSPEEGKADFMQANASISRGFHGNLEHPNLNESELRLSVESPLVASNPGAVMKTLREIYNDIPTLRENTDIETRSENISDALAKLHKMKAEGVNIPDAVFKWQGFNDKNREWTVREYAVDNIRTTEDGLHAQITIPMGYEGNAENSKKGAEIVAENIRSRTAEIKKDIANRYVKEHPEAKPEFVQALANIDIETSMHASEHYTTVDVTFRSQNQLDWTKNHPGETHPNPQELLHSNPLSELSMDKLGKIIGGAILHSDPRSQEIWQYAAGQKDIQSAIKYAIRDYQKNHSDKKTDDMMKVLNEEVFQNKYDWDKDPDNRTVKPQEPFVRVHPDHPNRLDFTFVLPEGKANEVIHQIAQLGNANAFSQVDSVELVGANSRQAFDQAKGVMAGFQQGGNQPQSLEESLTPMAQDLIGHVEAAHNAIQSAVKHAASVQQPQATAPEPAPRPIEPDTLLSAIRQIQQVYPVPQQSL